MIASCIRTYIIDRITYFSSLTVNHTCNRLCLIIIMTKASSLLQSRSMIIRLLLPSSYYTHEILRILQTDIQHRHLIDISCSAICFEKYFLIMRCIGKINFLDLQDMIIISHFVYNISYRRSRLAMLRKCVHECMKIDIKQYDVIYMTWHDTTRHTWHDMTQHNTIHYNSIHHNTIQFDTIRYNTIHTLWYDYVRLVFKGNMQTLKPFHQLMH